jgi:carbon-monoxide dehydrogenase iron sulfur subunit
MVQNSLNIDPGKCTGCLQCELACSFEHTGSYNPSRSVIKVFTFHDEGRFAPYTCTQCDEAWCQRACPVNAIQVDMQTGAKVIVDAKCVGCKVCTIACPFGTVNYSRATGKVVKCDLCGGDPQCVSACPTGAITYTDADWTGYGRMEAYAAKSLPSAEANA